jgi:glutamate--cysteine ligase
VIDRWYSAECDRTPPPFYSSLDVRDSGKKIAAVDCNLFPAGFNNLCEDDRIRSAPFIREEVERSAPEAKRILILPENHTKNTFYVENLLQLTRALQGAGYQVQIGWLPSVETPEEIPPSHAQTLQLRGNRLVINSWDPDLILLNNDLTAGYPKWMDSLLQPVVPSPHLGWHTRTKHTFFKHYNAVASEFADLLKIDSRALTIATETVTGVNFNDDVGLSDVTLAVDRILKNSEFVFIKNDAGTYGMGIHVVRSVKDVTTMNRREKNKLSMGKGHSPITSVIVQEGITTRLRFELQGKSLTAEPVIYMMGRNVMGGFLRVHREKGEEENLNSPGMMFHNLCLKDPQMGVVYPWIGRICALAAGREIRYK